MVTTFFNDEEDVSAYEYQKTLSDPIVEIIAGQEVTYYLNGDANWLSASWLNQNTHYSVIGDMTVDELCEIVRSIEG